MPSGHGKTSFLVGFYRGTLPQREERAPEVEVSAITQVALEKLKSTRTPPPPQQLLFPMSRTQSLCKKQLGGGTCRFFEPFSDPA